MNLRTGAALLLCCLFPVLISGSGCSGRQPSQTCIQYPVTEDLLLPQKLHQERGSADLQTDDSLITQMFMKFVNKAFREGEDLKQIFPLKLSVGKRIFCPAVTATFALGRRVIKSVSVMKTLISSVCLIVNRNQDVCSGIADLHAESVLHIVQQSNLASDEMASVILGARCMSRDRFMKSKLNWEVALPAATPSFTSEQQKKQVSRSKGKDEQEDYFRRSSHKDSGGKTLKFLHLTDVHLDLEYAAGEDVECSFPLCCRKNRKAGRMGSGGSSEISGEWGSLEGNCDCPLNLAQSTLQSINESISRHIERSPPKGSLGSNDWNQSKPPDFIIWTGDILPHDVWSTSRKEMIGTASEWSRQMKSFLTGSGIPIFPVLGNHEAMPVNMFSPPNATVGSSRWIYESFYNLWEEWFTVIDQRFDGNAKQFFRLTGSYSFSLTKTIRIIVLNTVYSSKENFWNLYQPNDLGEQLKFLVSELLLAESLGQSAHIIGHNPPNGECQESWLRNYIRVMGRFRSVIRGSFFGHTHDDHYYLYFGPGQENRRAYATAFVGGSVTPFGHVNPCYKIYTLSKDKGVVLDQETFYADIGEADRRQSQPYWKSLYSSCDAYGLKDLSTKQMLRLFTRLQRDPVMRNMYWDHLHRKANASDWTDRGERRQQKIIRDIRISCPVL